MTYLGFETWVGGFWGMSKTAEVHSGFGAFRKQGQFYYWLYQQLSIEANSRRAGATIDKVATITHIRLGRGMLEILWLGQCLHFVLIHSDHRMALSDVDGQWNPLCSIGEQQEDLAGKCHLARSNELTYQHSSRMLSQHSKLARDHTANDRATCEPGSDPNYKHRLSELFVRLVTEKCDGGKG